MTEITDGDTTWRFDDSFLTSNWTCIWGRGCLGILPQPAAQLGHGCCSIGAELDGEEEARRIAAMADTLDPERFEHHECAMADGIFGDASRTSTRVVDGACIFLNRTGFGGGAGCALPLAALDSDESPIDFKPSICWQLPIKADWEPDGDGTEVATVRGWTRRDWGARGGDHGVVLHRGGPGLRRGATGGRIDGRGARGDRRPRGVRRAPASVGYLIQRPLPRGAMPAVEWPRWRTFRASQPPRGYDTMRTGRPCSRMSPRLTDPPPSMRWIEAPRPAPACRPQS